MTSTQWGVFAAMLVGSVALAVLANTPVAFLIAVACVVYVVARRYQRGRRYRSPAEALAADAMRLASFPAVLIVCLLVREWVVAGATIVAYLVMLFGATAENGDFPMESASRRRNTRR